MIDQQCKMAPHMFCGITSPHRLLTEIFFRFNHNTIFHGIAILRHVNAWKLVLQFTDSVDVMRRIAADSFNITYKTGNMLALFR